MEPNTQRMLKTRFFRKVKRIAQSYDPKKLPTEEMRAQLILDLKVLAEIAFKQASKRTKKGGKFTRGHQKWAKLAAYISKCINVIMRDYDAVKIKAELQELKELVYDELLRDRETRN